MGIDATKSYLLKDRLFTNSSYEPAIYVDPGHTQTTVQYIPGNTPTKQGLHFNSRDDMLFHIAKTRLKENAELYDSGKISISERYQGIEDGLFNKIKGVAKRTFYIISAAWRSGSLSGSVRKGLRDYDLDILGRSKTKAWVNHSVKKVDDFILRPLIKGLNGGEHLQANAKIHTKSTWHHNGESNYSFVNENGEIEVLQNTVVSSNDRNAKKISMMRVVDDCSTNESIAYTGRADTKSKALEQLKFLFESELSKSKDAQKGLVQTSKDSYDLTFMVNNLMSTNRFLSIGLTGLSGLDERESVLNEAKLFMELSKEPIPITIKDKRTGKDKTVNISIKPLYFCQGFNFLATTYGTPWTEQEINKNEGYRTLLPMIESAIKTNEKISSSDRDLLKACLKHLQNPTNLKPQEEFFYRDLSMKILKIPVINHCKSSIDRTSLAVSIAASTQAWRNLGKPIPTENPHEILSDPLFKELFIVNIQGCHQATRASRAREGMIDGHHQLSRVLGFEWGSKGKGLKGTVVSFFQGQSPIALAMVPDRYLDASKENFNIESPLVKDRMLVKPKKLKKFYTNDNPHIIKEQNEKKAERERFLKLFHASIANNAAAAA